MKRILATLLTVAILGEQVSVISWAQEPSIESETAVIQEIEESTEETVTENEVEIVTEEECEVETEIETEVEAESETETEVEVLEEVTEPDTKQEYIYHRFIIYKCTYKWQHHTYCLKSHNPTKSVKNNFIIHFLLPLFQYITYIFKSGSCCHNNYRIPCIYNIVSFRYNNPSISIDAGNKNVTF